MFSLVPNSASFIRTKEQLLSSASHQNKARSTITKTSDEFLTTTPSVTTTRPQTSTIHKPLPPPKTQLFKSSPRQPSQVPNEPNKNSAVTTVNNRSSSRINYKPAISPKPRPLSHYEPLSKAITSESSNPTVQSSLNNQSSALSQQPQTEQVEQNNIKDADEKLAEYKRALAEKRAMYRKQQEEKPQVPVRRAVIVKPEPHNNDNDDNSSSSSSSSSDAENDERNDQRKQQKVKNINNNNNIKSLSD